MKTRKKPNETLELSSLHRGTLLLEYQPEINYAMTRSGMKMLHSSILTNKEKTDWREVRITISGQYILTSTCILDTLQSGHSMQLDTLQLLPDTFDQWSGESVAPQLLASFITPNHPYVQQLCRMAADQMQQWTGNASMTRMPSLPRLLLS